MLIKMDCHYSGLLTPSELKELESFQCLWLKHETIFVGTCCFIHCQLACDIGVCPSSVFNNDWQTGDEVKEERKQKGNMWGRGCSEHKVMGERRI